MGRSPCCDKVGLKKGPWTPEEDQKLLAYIEENGHGSWRALPAKAGLQRCGKSCRLRWTNYLRPDIKRGKFNLQEEQTIIQLHALLGNRWSAIATHLPKRTDNEIKNYWNTHLKKRLAKMGIDPVTHKPKNDALLSIDGQSKNAANLSHMAQWESARLEAEARLVRESKLRLHHHNNNNNNNNNSFQNHNHHHALANPAGYASSSSAVSSSSMDALKVNYNGGGGVGGGDQLESPTSTPPMIISTTTGENSNSNSNSNSNNSNMIEFVGSSGSSETTAGIIKEEGDQQDWKGFGDHHHSNCLSFTSLHQHDHMSSWTPESLRTSNNDNVMTEEGFTDLLLNNSDDHHRSLSDDSDNGVGGGGGGGGGSDDHYYEDNKNYWNSILNLVNSSPSDSPMF